MRDVWRIAKKTKGEKRYWPRTYKSNKNSTSSYAVTFLKKFVKDDKIE